MAGAGAAAAEAARDAAAAEVLGTAFGCAHRLGSVHTAETRTAAKLPCLHPRQCQHTRSLPAPLLSLRRVPAQAAARHAADVALAAEAEVARRAAAERKANVSDERQRLIDT